jgi:uncharacterized protein involved in tolerance to divalent cations
MRVVPDGMKSRNGKKWNLKKNKNQYNKSMPFLLIYVTHPSKPEAAKITADLLSKRLIACANYIPVSSVYMWEGFPTNTDEIVTIYKTRPENWEIIKTTIE